MYIKTFGKKKKCQSIKRGHKHSLKHFVNNNLLLTEREGRTGEYWPEVVAVRTERSEVRTKRPRANIPRYGSS